MKPHGRWPPSQVFAHDEVRAEERLAPYLMRVGKRSWGHNSSEIQNFRNQGENVSTIGTTVATPKEQLLHEAEKLLRTRGYAAFSYGHLSEIIGIRKASIHYHFRTKEALGATR